MAKANSATDTASAKPVTRIKPPTSRRSQSPRYEHEHEHEYEYEYEYEPEEEGRQTDKHRWRASLDDWRSGGRLRER